MTKVDIISGFLGAGKTTLIQLLLEEALKDEQVVLIENEFGEIGIDSGFLKNSGIEIKEMNTGCICCSLVGDFRTSLKEVIDTYHPDRVVIEPSGVGKLSDVKKAVLDVADSFDSEIHGYTTVVDVTKCKLYLRNVGEFYTDQLQYADTIILSRTDKASREKVEQAVELIRAYNPDAYIITTPIPKLGGVKVLEVMEGTVRKLEQELHEHSHNHDHGEDCKCGCHENEGHDRHHDHGEDCQCGCHENEGYDHHHDHGEDCECGCHEGEGHDHNHDHGEDCECGCHGNEGQEHHHHEHGEDCECGCHDHNHLHHADEVFSSWGKETIKAFSKDELENILNNLSDESSYGMVFRAKGMVAGKEGGWHYFDMVPGEFEVREGAPEFTGRLCVIGSELNMGKLESLFA